MFRREGPDRSALHNGVLAGYLAFVAGFVNAAGFVLLGVFTSHVTGNLGGAMGEVAGHDVAEAGLVVERGGPRGLLLVGAFFIGAVFASLVLEAHTSRSRSSAYGVALALESVLLSACAVAPASMFGVSGATLALPLSFAMGMQNSLVTRISGAVIRTTHLTGVVTDLGIEAARWLRWWWATIVRWRVDGAPPARPASVNAALLATIAVSFALGGVAGGLGALSFARLAFVLPAVALAGGAISAMRASARDGV